MYPCYLLLPLVICFPCVWEACLCYGLHTVLREQVVEMHSLLLLRM